MLKVLRLGNCKYCGMEMYRYTDTLSSWTADVEMGHYCDASKTHLHVPKHVMLSRQEEKEKKPVSSSPTLEEVKTALREARKHWLLDNSVQVGTSYFDWVVDQIASLWQSPENDPVGTVRKLKPEGAIAIKVQYHKPNSYREEGREWEHLGHSEYLSHDTVRNWTVVGKLPE